MGNGNGGVLKNVGDGATGDTSFLSVNAKVKFLGTDLLGVFETSTKSETVDSQQKVTKRTRMLVMPSTADTSGIRLTEAIRDINNLISSFSNPGEKTTSITEADIKAKMEEFGLTIFEKITLVIRQVYLLQDKTTITNGNGTPTDTNKLMEYAVNVEITNILTLPEDFKLFNIQSIGLAIWKTTNPKILSRMSIADIDTLLK